VPLALASTSLLLLGGQAYARTPKGRQQVAQLKEKATEFAHQVEQKAEVIGHQVADATKDLRENVNQQLAVAGQKLEEVGHQVADRTQGLRENVSQKVTEAGHKLDEVRGTLSQKVDEVKEFDAREALNKASAQVKDFGAEVAHRVADAKDSVKESLKDTGHQIQDAGAAALGQVKEKAHRLEEGFENSTRNYPLVTGLGFLALGIAAAVALPRTTPENRALGHLAKDVKQRVRGEGEKLVQKTKQAVDEAVTEVKEEVRQENQVIQEETVAS